MLRSNQDFTSESAFRRAPPQGFFRGDAHQIRIVIFLGDVRKDEIPRARIEALGIGKKLADSMIGKVPGTGKDALLDDPRIRANLEHVEIVVGLQD